MRFKYKMEHLSCGICADITDSGCPYGVCPYILDNLNDLFHDPVFREAVMNADDCDSYHRPTLLLLKRQDERIHNKYSFGRVPFIETEYGHKPDCANCSISGSGFICYSEDDGSCLKTDLDAALQRGENPCTA